VGLVVGLVPACGGTCGGGVWCRKLGGGGLGGLWVLWGGLGERA